MSLTTSTRSARSAVTLFSAGALAFGLAACSNSSGGGDELTYEDSPLNQFFADLPGQNFEDEDFEQIEREAQDSIAQCMQEQGFEYIPYVQSGGIIFEDQEGEASEQWGTREFAEKYGFGWTSFPGMDDPGEEEEYEEDPNWAIQEQLSESEQMAYQEALYGEDELVVEDDGSEYYTSTGGCYNEAYNSAAGIDYDALSQDPTFQAFSEKLNELYSDDSFMSDPRITEAEAEYVSCMADEGYPEVTAEKEAAEVFSEEYDEFVMQFEPDWDSMTEEEMEAHDYIDPATQPGYDEIQQREIDLAVADFDCNQSSRREQIRLEIEFEKEQAFIDENQADLDAVRDLMESLAK